jgi:hypothetical protein
MEEQVRNYLQQSFSEGNSEIEVNNIVRLDSAWFSNDALLQSQKDQISNNIEELNLAFGRFREQLEIDKLGEAGAESMKNSIDRVEKGLQDAERMQEESIASFLSAADVNVYQINADLSVALQTLSNRRYEGYKTCYESLNEAYTSCEGLISKYAMVFARFKSYYIEDAVSYFAYKQYEQADEVPYSVQFRSANEQDRKVILMWDQKNQKVVKHNEVFE